MITRRHALWSASSLAVAAAALASPALAFRIQEETDTPRVRALLAACETRDAHAKLIAELIADLDATAGPEQAKAAIRAMSCPLCGCSLAGGGPEDDPAPNF